MLGLFYFIFSLSLPLSVALFILYPNKADELMKLMNSNKLINSGDEADEIQEALLHCHLGVLGDLRVCWQDQRWDRQDQRFDKRLEMGWSASPEIAFAGMSLLHLGLDQRWGLEMGTREEEKKREEEEEERWGRKWEHDEEICWWGRKWKEEEN
jgi:hypothetical protein